MTVLQKVGIRTFSSFRRKPESRELKQLQFPWTPVLTGVTTFCVIVNLQQRTCHPEIVPSPGTPVLDRFVEVEAAVRFVHGEQDDRELRGGKESVNASRRRKRRSVKSDANPPDVIQQSRIVYFMQQREIDLPGEQQIIDPVLNRQQLRQPERFRFDAQIDVRTRAVRSHSSGAVKDHPADVRVIVKYAADLFNGTFRQARVGQDDNSPCIRCRKVRNKG